MMFDAAAVAAAVEALDDPQAVRPALRLPDSVAIDPAPADAHPDPAGAGLAELDLTIDLAVAAALDDPCPVPRHEIAFVDVRVEGVQDLLARLDRQGEVVVLDPGGDGLARIADPLGARARCTSSPTARPARCGSGTRGPPPRPCAIRRGKRASRPSARRCRPMPTSCSTAAA